MHVQKGSEQGRELLDLKADPDEYENKIDDSLYSGILSQMREKVIEHLLPSVLA